MSGYKASLLHNKLTVARENYDYPVRREESMRQEQARHLNRATGLDGAAKRKLVGILQVAAHGQAARQTRHLNAQWLDSAGQVARRGLALDVGVGGDDDLMDILVAQTRQQLADVQLLGTNLVHGADHAAQYVVETVVAARALNRLDVARLAHHANASGVAHRILADGALVGRGVVKAAAAKVNLLLNLQDGLGQAARLLGVSLQQVIGDALSRLGANARQATQLIEQFLQAMVGTHIYARLRTACPGC